MHYSKKKSVLPIPTNHITHKEKHHKSPASRLVAMGNKDFVKTIYMYEGYYVLAELIIKYST